MLENFEESVKALKDFVTSYDNYQNSLLLIEFDHTSLESLKTFTPLHPSRFEALILIGVTEGRMELQIDYKTYTADKNSLVIIMPTHIINFVNGSNDLKSWVLVISKPYFDATPYEKDKKRPPIVISYMQLQKNPLTVFEPHEYSNLYSCLDYVRHRMRQNSHIFQKDALKLALKMFFLDLGNVYLSKIEHYITPAFTRQEEVMIDFQNLLRESCTQQHDVKFYADKLCITTQYLSMILKSQSGRSTMQWIQEALMTEAKRMLKRPRTNIQQVSNELNFPDPSTFGKFFKKHAGMSPVEFRKK
ncbi:MAG: helix-turn-helix domain-containing protein [Tannerella sp.]|jgi:AraC-like DNA-binding protein|nr:helix-turn-helix domain-containing protein [Tannerella sp.]